MKLDEKIEEIKKEYEDLFTKPFEDTDDWVAHDSEKVWAWFESKLQKEREEAVRSEYIKWVDEKLILKTNGIENVFIRPVLYQVWANVKALVCEELHRHYSDERWYHEYKRDVYRFVSDAVANSMFILDKIGALKVQNEYLSQTKGGKR